VTNIGNAVTLYLDGDVVATANLNINTASNTQFLVGSLRGDPFRNLKGLVDDVAIYDHALSTEEVRAIVLAGSDGKCAAGSFLNGTPNADAGPDQSVDERTSVTFNGSASSDPENDPLTFHWIQTAGPGVSAARRPSRPANSPCDAAVSVANSIDACALYDFRHEVEQ